MDVQGKEITYTTQYQVLLLFINYLKDIKNPVLVDPIYATLICQSLLTGRKSSVYFQHLLKNKRFCRHLKMAKANEPSLENRRIKLGMQYATKLKTYPSNPAYDCVFNPLFEIVYDKQPNTIQPFGYKFGRHSTYCNS
jgi:hypothetical protein